MVAPAPILLPGRPSAIDNSRGNEDQELGAIVVFLLAAEEPTQDRDVREERHTIAADTGVTRVNTAYNRRVAIPDQHGGPGFLLLNGRIAARASIHEVGLVACHANDECDGAFVGDVRLDRKAQLGVHELRLRAHGADRRHRDRHAL